MDTFIRYVQKKAGTGTKEESQRKAKMSRRSFDWVDPMLYINSRYFILNISVRDFDYAWIVEL